MREIKLETFIAAPIDRVFDLARNIDVHVASNKKSGEKAVAGKVTGLVGLGDQVTWEAVHFGVRQRLTARVTAFKDAAYFEDIMIEGAFEQMHHRHAFTEVEGGALMVDTFTFQAPLGWSLSGTSLSRKVYAEVFREKGS